MTKEMVNALLAALYCNDKKTVVEILKDYEEKSNDTALEKEIFKTYVDLGHEIFDEVNRLKAEAECVKLIGLLNGYHNPKNKR